MNGVMEGVCGWQVASQKLATGRGWAGWWSGESSFFFTRYREWVMSWRFPQAADKCVSKEARFPRELGAGRETELLQTDDHKQQ